MGSPACGASVHEVAHSSQLTAVKDHLLWDELWYGSPHSPATDKDSTLLCGVVSIMLTSGLDRACHLDHGTDVCQPNAQHHPFFDRHYK